MKDKQNDDDIIDVDKIINSGKKSNKEIKNDVEKGAKIAKIILLIVVIVLILMRSIFAIDEQQNGIVTQFGEVIGVKTAGWYLKAPWQSLKKVDMTTHGTGIGYVVSETGQNIVDEGDGIMITSDFNLLNIDFYLEYRVADPIAYVYNSNDPEGILKNIAMANIRTIVSNYTVDEAMTTSKGQIQADVKEAILKSLEKNNIGLTVTNITVQDSEPPTQDIISKFKSVETAKQEADTEVNKAYAYQNSEIPAAEAEADKIIKKAEADKQSRIAEAEGQVERFNKVYEEYKKFPEVTKKRMFYEKMEEVMPGCKVVITDGETEEILPLDSFGDSVSSNN